MAFIWTDEEPAWYGVTMRDGYTLTVLANDADEALAKGELHCHNLGQDHGRARSAEWIEAHEAELWPAPWSLKDIGRDAEDEAYDMWRDRESA